MPETIRIQNDRASAAIAVDLGFNCYEFRTHVGDQEIDVLSSDPDFATTGGRASGNGIPILFPFPNRIRGGRFSWDGRDYQIPIGNRPHAIHGFALDTPWRVIDQGADFVVGQWRLSQDDPDRAEFWPADCQIEVRYELKGPVLDSRITITNPDEKPLPFGFGTHAYFKLPLVEESSLHHCLIQGPAQKKWVLEDFIPTGEIRAIDEAKDIRNGAYVKPGEFDDVLTDLRTGGETLNCIIMDESAGLEIVQACDASAFRELVIYAPPNRPAVCMEPYTCTTDAVNLHQRGIDAGWRVLEPGATFETWISISARRVYA